MIKVLITGFRHSGTTMLHQLIKAHPKVGWIENEEGFIEFDKSKDWILKLAEKTAGDLSKRGWGEKIPWSLREEDKNAQRAKNMINKWLKFFGKDGRVITIVRHPLDVALSGTNGKKYGKKEMDFILKTVPIVIEHTNKRKKCACVVYEDLLLNPEKHLKNIFDFLNINSSKKIVNKVINTDLKFGKINPERAFSHRKFKIDFEYDYDSLLNKIKNRL